ncbi:hypothetical protein VMCG_09345 [Cytospora schulzeri]|uniref:Aminoglycoside phosphotransferase domain-containing protein n=1 Tax=Cytospora schulzeri TaxID=448051 RepID=A0A423VJT6_9PEZI|nr:hypothetical protein VMCG_09345 [Valsa malicola]
MPSTPQSIIDDRRSSQRKAALACGQNDIWNASQSQESPPWGTARGFAYPLGSRDPEFFVKFTGSWGKEVLESEQRNHMFAFNTLCGLQQPASQQLKLLVCVPEIFRVFEYRERYFMVMEFVPGSTLHELASTRQDAGAGAGAGGQADNSALCRYIAEGIRLLCVKAPPGAKPGPVGGGLVRHHFFRYNQSAVPYRDVKMLETHLNKVLEFVYKGVKPDGDRPLPIVLDKELEFYYSDLSCGNFIFTSAGGHTVLYIIDFDEAGFLPSSFMTFVLNNPPTASRTANSRVTQDIHHLFELDKRDEVAILKVAEMMSTSSNRVGFPLAGYPETEYKKRQRIDEQ